MPCRIILILTASLVAAAAADGYPAPPDPAAMGKPAAGQVFAASARDETLALVAALLQGGPGVAVTGPVQAIDLPASAPSGAEAEALRRFAATRAAFAGMYAPVELQLLCAIADRSAVWGVDQPADGGTGVADLGALEQRRQIAMHAFVAHGGSGFADSPVGRRFERRRLQLQAADAPHGQVPQPAAAGQVRF